VEPDSHNLAGDAEFRAAWEKNEREVRIRTGKLACLLVIVLMPAGVVLDWMVFKHFHVQFFWLRIFCSLLVGGILALHYLNFTTLYYRVLQQFIVFLPAASIALMIYLTNTAPRGDRPLEFTDFSPYYAGLSLILVALSAVGHWNFRDSLISVLMIILLYAFAEYPSPWSPALGSNLYFLILTGIIVLAGNRVFNQLAFREFLTSYQLDQSRRAAEEANQKLLELDRVKNRFFANISHELRTPLTLLLAPLEKMLHDRRLQADRALYQLLQSMHSNGLRLLRLINDLLDLVRLESGKMEINREPIAMREFLQGLVSAVRNVADDRHIRIQLRVDDAVKTVMADLDKLEKILLNLIFNALKFTPAGGRVSITCGREGDELVLSVSDTGVGIPPEKQPFVFQRFWQGDVSAQRKYQGAGIGLALVKELTEIQQGRIEVQSTPGQGATFTVHLPYLVPAPGTPAPAPKEQPAPAPAPAAETARAESPAESLDTQWLQSLYRRAELLPTFSRLHDSVRPAPLADTRNLPKILVADDEPDMLGFLRLQLEEEYRVIEAVDGEQAIALARQYLPDAVLCDMMMPGADGLTVCRQLRQGQATRTIPILLITARADEETKLAALDAGASDFLAKPFSVTELRVRLRNLVFGSQLQRQLARQNQVLESTLAQLKETEAQLVGAEKMAALGRLSAGIMHEVSNPLNFLKTCIHVLRTRIPQLPENHQTAFNEVLADIEDGLTRVQGIVGDLRTFAHPDPVAREGVRVEHLINVTLRFLRAELKDGVVRLDLNLAPQHAIFANRNQMIQVLLNLLQNAIYAVKRKQYPPGVTPTIRIESGTRNGMDYLVVRDNGPGVRTEHLNKLFEPFFTTKEVGEGVGLGLSICYRIIQQHGGRISVDSRAGEYCQFTIELPRREPGSSRDAAPPPAAEAAVPVAA
jgi:signal transduction histidine kinase